MTSPDTRCCECKTVDDVASHVGLTEFYTDGTHSHLPIKPQPASWSERFDEMVIMNMVKIGGYSYAKDKIKSFIAKVEAEAYERGKDDAIYAMDEQAKNHWFAEGEVRGRNAAVDYIESAFPGCWDRTIFFNEKWRELLESARQRGEGI